MVGNVDRSKSFLATVIFLLSLYGQELRADSESLRSLQIKQNPHLDEVTPLPNGGKVNEDVPAFGGVNQRPPGFGASAYQQKQDKGDFFHGLPPWAHHKAISVG